MNLPSEPSVIPVALSSREKARLQQRHALHLKYERAVDLYAETDKSLKDIADECGVSCGALGNYLRRYWRELVLRRHRIHTDGKRPQDVKIIEAGKENVNAHLKYKDAIDAAGSTDYIDLNMSQIARKFGVGSTALSNFMRVHYMDILTWREKTRQALGIDDHISRGAKRKCVEQYAEAVALYRTTDMTIPEVAERCHVSPSGLSQHLRFYHKEVLQQKRKRRKTIQGAGKKPVGALLGNGRKYRPAPETERKYAEALTLYRDTALTMKEIVERTKVSAQGFRFYVHKWHKNLVLQRAGISDAAEGTDLRKARKRMKTVAAKYAQAIDSLRQQPRPIARVAAEYGFTPEVFRNYLHKHEPELARQQGMKPTANGHRMSRRSDEKYAEAIHLYDTTTESLKSIATRLGLAYKSIGGYVRRNYPEVIAHHQALAKASAD